MLANQRLRRESESQICEAANSSIQKRTANDFCLKVAVTSTINLATQSADKLRKIRKNPPKKPTKQILKPFYHR
jgi:uncharacterized protein (DUF1778 family)